MEDVISFKINDNVYYINRKEWELVNNFMTVIEWNPWGNRNKTPEEFAKEANRIREIKAKWN